MTISTLKDLEKLIALCRKKGVSFVKIDNVELSLGDEPTKPIRQITAKQYVADNFGEIGADVKIQTPDELTEEQLLMWSAGATSDTI